MAEINYNMLMHNGNALLSLGTFKFSVSTAAFAELQRSQEWLWAEQSQIGRAPALQCTGKGAESITLPCVVYPGQYGQASSLTQLQEMGDSQKPHYLVSGTGVMLGQWVIKSLAETHSGMLKNGAARKIEFTLTLVRYA